MPIDPAISLQYRGQPIPNPFELMGVINDTRAKVNQNLEFQQRNDAQNVFGQLFQNALRPDGTVDEIALMRELSTNPVTARFSGEFMQQAIARQREAEQLMQQKVATQKSQMELISGSVASLRALGPGLTKADVIEHASRLIPQINDPKFTSKLLAELKSLPEGGPELQKSLQQWNLRAMSALEQLNAISPPVQQVNAGGETLLVSASPLLGAQPRVVGRATQTPTPEQRNALVPAQDEEGAPIALTREQAAPMVDGSGNTVSVPDPNSPKKLGPSITGRADLTGAGETFNRTMENITNQIRGSQANMQQIYKMRELLEKSKTGIDAGLRTTLGQFATTLGMKELGVKIQGGADAEAVSAAEQLIKGAWQQSLASFKASMPAGTQWTGQEIFQNYESNPNIKLTPQAIRELFDFEAFRYKYLSEEQKFRTNWKEMFPNRPLRQMETDWKEKAEKEGWVKPVQSGPGQGQTFINAPLKFDPLIPQGLNLVEHLAPIPRGARRTFELDDGTRVTIRRGTGDKANTFELVPQQGAQ